MMGKGENACYKHFLFHNLFKNFLSVRIVWQRVKCSQVAHDIPSINNWDPYCLRPGSSTKETQLHTMKFVPAPLSNLQPVIDLSPSCVLHQFQQHTNTMMAAEDIYLYSGFHQA